MNTPQQIAVPDTYRPENAQDTLVTFREYSLSIIQENLVPGDAERIHLTNLEAIDLAKTILLKYKVPFVNALEGSGLPNDQSGH